jgi:putative colanic acid biosynthesis glycosyltransferase WcaI
MRVLILSQYYWPEPIPKPQELARALRRMGDQVTVITGFPDYPSGRLYDGYKLALMRKEVIDGIDVIRTFEYPYHGTRAVGRFANYLSFMMSALLGSLFAPNIDVIYVWHPPLTIGISAWLIARSRGIPFVYDVQDIWPEAAVLSGVLKPGFLVRCLSALERFVYRRADHLLTVTEGARANLISKGAQPGKVSALPNWYSSDIFTASEDKGRAQLRSQYGWDGKFVALFAGNIGLVQGLETIVRAADFLREDQQVQIVFVGDGVDKMRLIKLVRSLSLENRVQFIERQAMERIPAFMAAADALLVHLKWSELSNYVIPTKTLAYLASGKPIVMAMSGAAAELVRAAGGGCIVAPDDPAAMAAGIREILKTSLAEREKMGQHGRAYIAEHFAEGVVVPKYRAVLEHVVAGEGCGTPL